MEARLEEEANKEERAQLQCTSRDRRSTPWHLFTLGDVRRFRRKEEVGIVGLDPLEKSSRDEAIGSISSEVRGSQGTCWAAPGKSR
ncbi:MAG: hypothetical protein IPN51_07475 [Chloracidobacterium sp.]|nr:hypothetical protein [Chloracidobacterium sp.]